MQDQNNVTFETWATKVIEFLVEEEQDVWQKVLDYHNLSKEAPAAKTLKLIRSDEAEDAYNNQEPACDYAEYLLEEWNLFGVEGE